ncbi:MAG: cbb3-type cytochrome c oxidase subunit I, partial [Chloroflexota bacterium]
TQRKLIYGWLLYAVGAAAIGGLLAFAVAMTRTPGVRLLPSARAFQVILVGHVTYTLTIWLLAFISAIWAYVAAQAGLPLNRRVNGIALATAVSGAAILTIPIVLFQGRDVMTDYVPLLDTPLFFVGFVTFLAGIGIAAMNYLAAVVRHRAETRAGTSPAPTMPLAAYGMACAAAAALIALAALGVAALRLGIGANGREPAAYYQAMFWGMGHSFQYVSVAAMTVTWFILGCVFIGPPKVNPKLARGAFTLFALFPLATFFPYFLYDPISVPTQRAWGISLDVGLSLPVLILGPMILIWAWQARREKLTAWVKRIPWSDPRLTALVFSAALFALGLSIHPAARQGTLRTPAHYHSVVVGGVTLAFMGLAYHLLHVLNRELVWRKIVSLQPHLFASGMMLLVLGLLSAGDLGAPRKTYDAAVVGVAWLRPMVLVGIGAGTAVLGGALFVAVLLLVLLRKTPAPAATPEKYRLVGEIGD